MTTNDQPTDSSTDNQDISKTQRKKNMLELQTLGEQLVKLSNKDLLKIPLTEELKKSIVLAQNMRSDNGRRRQLQYIGKLMRHADAKQIQEAYDKTVHPTQKDNQRFKRIEKLRDQLLTQGDSAIPAVLAILPNADRQQLRQYIRNIRKESDQERAPVHARKLFKYLRQLSDE